MVGRGEPPPIREFGLSLFGEVGVHRIDFQLIMDHLPSGGSSETGTETFRRRLRPVAYPLAILGLALVGTLIGPRIANAVEEPVTLKPVVEAATSPELQPLQGVWDGVFVGDSKSPRITITITGDSLHFHRDTNFWFETTFTLPPGKNPKQLHATIQKCPPSQADSLGQVVRAFFKIEEGTLTLATLGDDETAKGFETSGTRYELRKLVPPSKNSPPSSVP